MKIILECKKKKSQLHLFGINSFKMSVDVITPPFILLHHLYYYSYYMRLNNPYKYCFRIYFFTK